MKSYLLYYKGCSVRYGQNPNDLSSIVLVKLSDFSTFNKSTAVIISLTLINPVLIIPMYLILLIVPVFLRDMIYDFIANIRYHSY